MAEWPRRIMVPEDCPSNPQPCACTGECVAHVIPADLGWELYEELKHSETGWAAGYPSEIEREEQVRELLARYEREVGS